MEKPIKKRFLNKRGFAIAALRRASLRWPARTEAVRAAKIGRNEYKCNMCGKSCTYKEKQVDHIIPVVDEATGFTTFDSYVDRLYVEAEQFQVLCKTCHSAKTLLGVKKRPKKTKKQKE